MIVSLSIAFFAGLISFVSPCVLPLIPGYVSFICGTTLNELDLKSKNFILKKSLSFSFGFSLVFISLGATATFIGSFLLHNSQICLLYTSPSPRDRTRSRMPSSA